ncbi:MAG: hypothetical protein KAH18_09740 [Psychromonas sp.]|nr:hypothetical protein [Psychromonas sp.]
MDINTELRQLFTMESELKRLLKNKEVEKFHQRQQFFTDQVSIFLKQNSPDVLTPVMKDLKLLEKRVGHLCSEADIYMQELKAMSLLQQRNKNKLNAYK